MDFFIFSYRMSFIATLLVIRNMNMIEIRFRTKIKWSSRKGQKICKMKGSIEYISICIVSLIYHNFLCNLSCAKVCINTPYYDSMIYVHFFQTNLTDQTAWKCTANYDGYFLFLIWLGLVEVGYVVICLIPVIYNKIYKIKGLCLQTLFYSTVEYMKKLHLRLRTK